MSVGYLQGCRLHSFSGQPSPSLKKPYEILFPSTVLAFVFLQLKSVAPCLLAVHPWRGSSITVFTSPTRLLSAPCKTISSQVKYAKLPQTLLVHSVTQSLAIPVTPQAFSTLSTILQPCSEQWPSHSQHWIIGRCRLEGIFIDGCWCTSCPLLNNSSCCCCFWWYQANNGWRSFILGWKPLKYAETLQLPAAAQTLPAFICMPEHKMPRSSYLKVLVACVLLCGCLFIAIYRLMLAALASLYCLLVM